ncbi:hypothetical protein BHE74_00048908 [Ensete ventricosum]|nr:hypothetical protein GW17_00034512 [Ensete ventricosum]RWW45262.1 hypothetical protein BHE74_00048908 [Ensete ventricosum]RZS24194.1 hypothetical protein BHM03_00057237 [Ensete ventricosum]
MLALETNALNKVESGPSEKENRALDSATSGGCDCTKLGLRRYQNCEAAASTKAQGAAAASLCSEQWVHELLHQPRQDAADHRGIDYMDCITVRLRSKRIDSFSDALVTSKGP